MRNMVVILAFVLLCGCGTSYDSPDSVEYEARLVYEPAGGGELSRGNVGHGENPVPVRMVRPYDPDR